MAPVTRASRLLAVVNCALESPPGKLAVLLTNGLGFDVVLKARLYWGTIPPSLKFRIFTHLAVVPNLNTCAPFTNVVWLMRSWFLGARPCCRKFWIGFVRLLLPPTFGNPKR